MINVQRLVEEIRRELDLVEQEIRRRPYLAGLETGRVRRFAGEQHHVIQSDLRSVALLVNSLRSDAFQAVLPGGCWAGETAALAALGAFAAAVAMGDARLPAYEPAPTPTRSSCPGRPSPRSGVVRNSSGLAVPSTTRPPTWVPCGGRTGFARRKSTRWQGWALAAPGRSMRGGGQ